MSTDSLSRAFASTRAVLAGIDPGRLDDPTPCRLWTVRQLINHAVTAPRAGVGVMRTGDWHVAEDDFASGDFVAAYDATAADALDAFGDPAALEKAVKLPFAEVTGSFLMMMVTTDQFTHGWDLAKATGQSTDLDPGLATELLERADIPDHLRGEEGKAPFGPRRQAPEGAPAADRLAAQLGREV
jgi:uncharacterized protein (TIGR03086 family)